MTLLEELNVYMLKRNVSPVDTSYLRTLKDILMRDPKNLYFTDRYSLKCILGFLADKIKEEEK